MAESRPVPANILSWPRLENLLPDQKLIFVYFWFNRFTNACGCYQLPLKMAAMELSVSPSSLAEAIADFKNKKIIDFDFETNELYVLDWTRFHKFNNVLQRVMYWTAAGRIQSSKLGNIVIQHSTTIQYPFNGEKSTIYDQTKTTNGTSTATETKQYKRGTIPFECKQQLARHGFTFPLSEC